MSSIHELVHCLFCASPCSPTFAVIDGNLIRVKTEDEEHDEPEPGSSPSLQFLDKEEPPLLAHQLQVIFILKRILNFEDEKLAQFLRKVGGQLDPEFWVRVCKSCENLVREYYEAFKKDLELKRKMSSICIRLKDIIEETREVHEAMEEEEEESPAIHIWKEVRETVLNQNGARKDVDESQLEMEVDTSPSVKTIFNKIGNNSAEILMDGDIRAEWYGEEGTLHLDVPDLSTLKEILGLDFKMDSGQASNHKVFMQEKQFPNKKQQQRQNLSSQSESRSTPSLVKKTTNIKTTTASPSTQSKRTLQRKKKNEKGSTPIPTGFMKCGKNIFRKLTCEQCPYFTWSSNYLERHQRLHQPGPLSSKAITCSICSWVMLPSIFAAHNDLHHPSQTLENQEDQEENEMTENKSKKYFKCPDCGSLSSALTYLKGNHLKLHESGKGVTCSECGWLTSNLKTHMINWHPQEGTPQARLRKRTASYEIVEMKWVDDLKSESRQGQPSSSSSSKGPSPPSPRRPANMKLTTAASIRQSKLIRAKRRKKNHSLSEFTCELCSYSTSKLQYLQNHQVLHQPNSKGVTCTICGWLLLPNKLKQHFDIRHPTETFEGYDGEDDGDEEFEEKLAKNNKYYKCPYCGALLSSLIRLRKDHMKLHEKGEGVKCEECGWLTSNLKTHMVNWHPPEGSIQAKVRKRTASYPIFEVGKRELLKRCRKRRIKSETEEIE